MISITNSITIDRQAVVRDICKRENLDDADWAALTSEEQDAKVDKVVSRCRAYADNFAMCGFTDEEFPKSSLSTTEGALK